MMTPKELKNSILQLAIEGKLVEQRKEEGSAEDLYAEIQKEKQKLIKEGKIKKEKPLPEIAEDEVPFEIPKSWKWCRISECFDTYTGNSIAESIKTTKYMNLSKGYNYIGTKDVSFEQEINYNNGVKIPYNEEGFKKAEKGSVLMCIEGGSAGRKIALINEEVCFGNKLCKFKQFSGNNKYIFYYLQSPQFVEQFKENLTGIIGGVSIQKIKEIVFPLPPLAEQSRIVAKIEELMPLVDRYEVLYNRLNELNKEFPKKLKNAVLQKAIEGKLVEQRKEEGSAEDLYAEIQKEKQKLIKEGKIKKEKPLPEITEDEVPFEIPKSWKWCRISECFDTYTGNSIAESIKTTKYMNLSKGYNYIGTKDVSFEQEINYNNGVKIPYNEEGFKKAEKGSVLMCIEGGSAGRKIALINEEVCFGNKLCKFKQFSGNNKYIFYYLQSPQFVEQFKENLTGIIGGVSIQKIKEIVFPLPPLTEQSRIVAKIEELMSLIDKLKKF